MNKQAIDYTRRRPATVTQILFSGRPSKAARKAAHQAKCDRDFQEYLKDVRENGRKPKIKDSMLAKQAVRAQKLEANRARNHQAEMDLIDMQERKAAQRKRPTLKPVRSLADI